MSGRTGSNEDEHEGLPLHVEGAGGDCDGGGQPRIVGTRNWVLKYPEEGISPGYKRSRKSRKDGLMQTSLLISGGVPFSLKSERGFKMGCGD